MILVMASATLASLMVNTLGLEKTTIVAIYDLLYRHVGVNYISLATQFENEK